MIQRKKVALSYITGASEEKMTQSHTNNAALLTCRTPPNVDIWAGSQPSRKANWEGDREDTSFLHLSTKLPKEFKLTSSYSLVHVHVYRNILSLAA